MWVIVRMMERWKSGKESSLKVEERNIFFFIIVIPILVFLTTPLAPAYLLFLFTDF